MCLCGPPPPSTPLSFPLARPRPRLPRVPLDPSLALIVFLRSLCLSCRPEALKRHTARSAKPKQTTTTNGLIFRTSTLVPHDGDGDQWRLLNTGAAPFPSSCHLSRSTSALPYTPCCCLQRDWQRHLQRQRTPPSFVIATDTFVAPMPRAAASPSRSCHPQLDSSPLHPRDRPWSWSPTPMRRRPRSRAASPTLYDDAHTPTTPCAPVLRLKLSAYPLRPSHRVRPSLDARASAQPQPDCAPLVPLVRRSSRRLPTPSPIATSISVTPGPRVGSMLATAPECVPPCALGPRCRPRVQLRYTPNPPLVGQHHPPRARTTTRIECTRNIPTYAVPPFPIPSTDFVLFYGDTYMIIFLRDLRSTPPFSVSECKRVLR
ncbi:hypothetical protein K438DRAFT_499825 [Mycena galopus ATCC 62051]|nr:hypothetical protein K438DRAFT_499825 [Mycena galopus ATCC 62051]